MAQFSRQWSASTATNMHSSNPQPFSWTELETLTGQDLSAWMQQTAFHYESTQGDVGVREALAEHNYHQAQAQQVVLTSGAQEGLFVVLHSLLSAGDQVVTFTPCFEPLVQIAESLGAEVNRLALKHQDHWSLPWEQLTAAITSQTKLLIINFPHNPTGKNISTAELQRLIDLCDQNGCWLLSDEVFRGLEHQPDTQLPAVVDGYERGISMGVMSKATALPGIRLGWLVMQDEALIQRCLEVKSHLSICQSSLDARLCQLLLPYSQQIHQRNIEIIGRNKILVAGLIKQAPQFRYHPPDASATTFVELTQGDAVAFCQNMIETEGVFLMPNPAFLTAVPGFRLTLGKSHATPLLQTIFAQS